MLQQSVSKFISQDYDWDSRQAIAKSATGFSAEHWQLFAELGWLTIPFKEDDGGFGGSAVDLIVTMQEFGKGLLVEPFLANTILAGTVISEAGSSEQKATLLAPLMEGSLQLAFAYAEPQSRYELSNVQCSVVINGDEMVLNGHKSVVLNGAAAEKILVSVRTSGESCDREGISLIWVDASTPGVRRECYASVDGQRAADIWFDNVALPASNLLGNVGEAIDVIEMTVDKATLALAQAKSILLMAAMEMDSLSGHAPKAVSAAKSRIGKAARLVGEESIQIHGGIGVTDELDVGHYFKRLTAIQFSFGSTDHHTARFAAS
jgi:alkylation response protein AidB-like acyl-CoA dehydrogenase